VVCQSPPLDEALETRHTVFPSQDTRLLAGDHGGGTRRRLEKKVLSYTGEILRRPMVGKSLL